MPLARKPIGKVALLDLILVLERRSEDEAPLGTLAKTCP